MAALANRQAASHAQSAPSRLAPAKRPGEHLWERIGFASVPKNGAGGSDQGGWGMLGGVAVDAHTNTGRNRARAGGSGEEQLFARTKSKRKMKNDARQRT